MVFIGENVCLLYAFILGILKNGMLPLNLWLKKKKIKQAWTQVSYLQSVDQMLKYSNCNDKVFDYGLWNIDSLD